MPGTYDENQHRRTRNGQFATKPVLAAATTTHNDVTAAAAADTNPDDWDQITPQGNAANSYTAINSHPRLEAVPDGRTQGFAIHDANNDSPPILATSLPNGSTGLRLPNGKLCTTATDQDTAALADVYFQGRTPNNPTACHDNQITDHPVGYWYGTATLDEMDDDARTAATAVGNAPHTIVTNDGRGRSFLAEHSDRQGQVDCSVLEDGRIHARFPDIDHDGYVLATTQDTNRAITSWAAGRSPTRDLHDLPAPPSMIR